MGLLLMAAPPPTSRYLAAIVKFALFAIEWPSIDRLVQTQGPLVAIAVSTSALIRISSISNFAQGFSPNQTALIQSVLVVSVGYLYFMLSTY